MTTRQEMMNMVAFQAARGKRVSTKADFKMYVAEMATEHSRLSLYLDGITRRSRKTFFTQAYKAALDTRAGMDEQDVAEQGNAPFSATTLQNRFRQDKHIGKSCNVFGAQHIFSEAEIAYALKRLGARLLYLRDTFSYNIQSVSEIVAHDACGRRWITFKFCVREQPGTYRSESASVHIAEPFQPAHIKEFGQPWFCEARLLAGDDTKITMVARRYAPGEWTRDVYDGSDVHTVAASNTIGRRAMQHLLRKHRK